MLFNSYIFIFIFLPLTILLYFGLNRFGLSNWAKISLILASLLFYAFFNLSYLPIIIFSIIVNYSAAWLMGKFNNENLSYKKIF